MRDEDIKHLYTSTELTLQEIGDKLNLSFYQVWWTIQKHFDKDFQQTRKKVSYRNSKLGELNPMFGLRGADIHNYKGDVADGNGYLMRLKPDWYTGRKGCKHVFAHHLTMCEALGITEIPKGFHVHHIDKDKHNNAITNLALLTASAHTRLHQLERATTSSIERRD